MCTVGHAQAAHAAGEYLMTANSEWQRLADGTTGKKTVGHARHDQPWSTGVDVTAPLEEVPCIIGPVEH